MKKFITIALIFLMVIVLATGCSSGKTTSPQTAPPADSSAGNQPAQSSQPAVSDNDPVPLVEGFPQETPLPDGVIWGCEKLDIRDKDRNPTGMYMYRVNIDTTLGSVTEAYEFYEAKFTEVTRKGHIDTQSSTHMAEIEGYAGDLHISLIAIQTRPEKPVEVTVMVRHKDTMDK